MGLSKSEKRVEHPASHYIYVEKIGPFQETAMKAWQEFHQLFKENSKNFKIAGAMAQFKIEPKMIYRAGYMLSEKPTELPKELSYTKTDPTSYVCFKYLGSYDGLGEAWGEAMAEAEKKRSKLLLRFTLKTMSTIPRLLRAKS